MFSPRTLAEIKEDIRSRVGKRAPFLHADKAEADEALAKLDSIEAERWAAAWSAIGARWEEKARAAETRGDAKPAKEAFLKAYGYYGIALLRRPARMRRDSLRRNTDRRPPQIAKEASRAARHALGRHR
jgi:hypothetical protein